MTMTYDVEFADLQALEVALVRARVSPEEIPAFLGAAFAELSAVAGSQGVTVTGPAYGRYEFGLDGEVEVEAGFPVSGAAHPEGRVETDTLPGGMVALTVHVGAYADVAGAYEAAQRAVTANGYEPDGRPWERYLDDPETPQPRTEVFLPCRPVRPHTARV